MPPQNSTKGLQVIGDSGKPVDWWFIYKVAGAAQSTNGTKPTGHEYVYFDADMAKSPKSTLVLSKRNIDDATSPLMATLNQALGRPSTSDSLLGWFCYNDEDHLVAQKDENQKVILDADGKPKMGGAGPDGRGHCKGCLAFDLATKTAFWLIHSVPLFPLTAKLAYPTTGYKEAQTFLCIQLKNDAVAMDIAQLMFDAHGPNVNVASDLLWKAAMPANNISTKPESTAPYGKAVTAVPATLAKQDAKDPRLALMLNRNGSMNDKPKPYPPGNQEFLKALYPGVVVFNSAGGATFTAIAKNKWWGQDFYNDMVSLVLKQNLDVETWEDSTAIPDKQKPGDYSVEDATGVDLSKLGTGIPYFWSESNDHAKLAISDRLNPLSSRGTVCVGDINFTDAQEKRGGGTVAFECPPLWQALSSILVDDPGVKAKRAVRKKAADARKAKKSATSQPGSRDTKSVKSKKSGIKQAGTKSAVNKKVAVKKASVKKPATKKSVTKSVGVTKTLANKSISKKVAAKKLVSKKSANKKVTTKKSRAK